MAKISATGKYLGFATSFGLTMAITVYFLFKGGQWLDVRLGTTPIFMFLGVILGVAAVFKRLLTDLKTLDKMDKSEEDPE